MTGDRFRVLHLRRMRRNRLRTAAAVLGIAAGVALVTAMGSLVTSSAATARSTVSLLGGARYEVVVAATDSERAAAALRARPGVLAVGRYVEVPVLVDGTLGWLVATEDGGRPLATGEARALAAATGVRTGSSLPGAGVHTLTTASGDAVAVTVDGRADHHLAGRFGGLIVTADLATAQRLRGDGAPVTLLVHGDPDPADLAAAVGPAQIHRADDRVVQARNTMQLMFSSLAVLGAMGLVVGSFLVFNTMNMAVLDQRPEIASLRALGSDRRSIWRGVLAESAVVGGAGSLLGVALGTLAARGAVASVPDAFARTIGSPLRVAVTPTLLVATWMLGVATALAASVAPARRALRVEPIEALRPDTSPIGDGPVSVHPGPLTAGTLLVAVAGVAPASLLPPAAAMGAAFLGLLALIHGGGPLIVGVAGAIARRLGPPGELAASSLARAPRRVWATTASVTVAIAIVVTTNGLAANLRTTLRGDLDTARLSDLWIGSTTGDTIAVTGLPPSWTGELGAITGVRAVAGSTWVRARSGRHIVGVQGVLGDSGYPFSRLADDEARALMAAGTGAIVLRQYATTFNRRVGDLIDLPDAQPPLRLPIVAISDAVSPASGGMISISHDLLAAHYGVSAIARYEVQLEPDAEAGAVRADVERLVAGAGFPVHVASGQEFVDELGASADQVLGLVAMVLLVVIVCAGVAVLNTLLASVLERTGELAVLRAVGATRRQLVRAVACEAVAIGLTGGLLGSTAGSALHVVVVRRVRDLTNLHLDYRFSPATAAVAVGAGIAIAVVGGVVPARRVAKLDLLESLGA